MRQKIRLDGIVTPEDAQGHYTYLPFEVPAGVRQLHVAYSYNDQIDSDPLIGGGNTLDIGMFDERGIAPSSPGYRGWSGSEKMAFTIDAEWATPPYRAGASNAPWMVSSETWLAVSFSAPPPPGWNVPSRLIRSSGDGPANTRRLTVS